MLVKKLVGTPPSAVEVYVRSETESFGKSILIDSGVPDEDCPFILDSGGWVCADGSRVYHVERGGPGLGFTIRAEYRNLGVCRRFETLSYVCEDCGI